MVSPIERGLQSLARPLADTITNYNDLRSLSQENDTLRGEIESLTAENARLREDATRQQQLERLLDVKDSLSAQEFTVARIIARDANNLRQIVVINRGRDAGVRAGMPVVGEGQTLVGTVTRVEANHAWVSLVTDIDSAVSALVLESRAQGVVGGGYNRKLAMEFVAQEANLREGDTVITSGLGGTYPAGLVIGKITGLSSSRQELFQRVTVEPLASLARLENVLIMTSFMPQAPSRP